MRNSTLLRLTARCLPREFRERVFEPAVDDYHLDAASARLRGGAQVKRELWIALECLRLGVPQLFWHRGRPTPIGRMVALALTIGVAVTGLLAMRIDYNRPHP